MSACLPSLRPLFARLWKPTPRKHHNGTASTHGSFNRLQDFGPVSVPASSASGCEQARKEPWGVNTVTVLGGFTRAGRAGDDDGEEEDEGEVEEEVPAGRIRAKTEVVVSISERVDWRDDLF